jgi:hypothetical protein
VLSILNTLCKHGVQIRGAIITLFIFKSILKMVVAY